METSFWTFYVDLHFVVLRVLPSPVDEFLRHVVCPVLVYGFLR